MGGTSSSPRAESSSNRQGAFSPAPPYVNQNPSHVTQHDHCTDIPVYDQYPSYPPPRDKYSSHASPGDQYPSYPPPHDKYSSHTSPGDQYPSYPPQSDYAPQSSYAPQPSYAPSPQSYGHQSANPKRKLDKRYSMIADQYSSFDQVTEALAQSGLESSNLIVGIDFTKSNEWTGSRSFNRKSLHHIGDIRNPYEKAMSIIGRTLSAFDDDNLIPCFGFGDASTHDQDVFSFYPDGRSCYGFEEALARYREIVPHLRLAGPTSFAPIIEMAMTIVEQSGGQYHVLLIIADGQVTRSVNTLPGQLSPQEQKTVDAIVKASEYPLSIILVGVGDGPWDMMKEFDDNIPARAFDNFQFVNFTEIMSKSTSVDKSEREFAVTALMEIPSQYKATVELGLLSRKRGNAPQRIPLPPPMQGRASLGSKSSFQTSVPPPYPRDKMSMGTAPPESSIYPDVKSMGTAPSESSAFDNQVCPICLTERKDMAFGCGHQTCRDCGRNLELCPICRTQIQTRIKLY